MTDGIYHYVVSIDASGDVMDVLRYEDGLEAAEEFASEEQMNRQTDKGDTCYLLGADSFATLLKTHGNIFGLAGDPLDLA